jgi:hypothetical protein
LIYLDLQSPPTSILDVIIKLHSGEGNSSVRTYSDKECTIRQCYGGAWRSYEDTLNIVRTYFPEATEEQVTHAIIDSESHLKESHLILYSCDEIERINYYYSLFDSMNKSSWLVICQKQRESNKTWKQRLADIGINSWEELSEILKK